MTSLQLNHKDNLYNTNFQEIIYQLLASNYPDLILNSISDKQIDLSINGFNGNFLIKLPDSDPGIYNIIYTDELSFLSYVNIKFNKKINTIDEIFVDIQKCINKEKNKVLVSFDYKKYYTNLNIIDNFDSNVTKEIQEIMTYITSSVSLLSNGENSQISVDKIIDEYRKTKIALKNNSKINISMIDKNIFCWDVFFTNFDSFALNTGLNVINTKYKYNYIHVQLLFHNNLYPDFPIKIRYVCPRLINNLLFKITNFNKLLLKWYNSNLSVYDIIKNLRIFLEKNAYIDTQTKLNDNKLFSQGAYTDFEYSLSFPLMFIEDIIFQNSTDKLLINSIYETDPVRYNQLLEEDYRLLKNTMNSLSKIIIDSTDNNIINIIKKSNIIYVLYYCLKKLCIFNKEEEFDSHFLEIVLVVIELLYYRAKTQLFNHNYIDNEIINKLGDMCDQLKNKIDNKTYKSLCQVFNMLNNDLPNNTLLSNKTQNNGSRYDYYNEYYINEMNKFKLFALSSVNFYDFQTDEKHTLTADEIKKINRDIKAMINHVNVSAYRSSFFGSNAKNITQARYIIVGREKSAYDSGIFIFDINFPVNYDQVPPKFKMRINGSDKISNFVDEDGDICIKHLITENKKKDGWIADKINEKYFGNTFWSSNTYFTSICKTLDFIFSVEYPHKLTSNPTHDDFEKLKWDNKEFLNIEQFKIRLNVLKHYINDYIENMYHYNMDIFIKKHFILKKDYIIETYGKFLNECPKNLKEDFNKEYSRLLQNYNSLKEEIL